LPIGCIRVVHDAFLQLGGDVGQPLQRHLELGVLVAPRDLQQLIAGQNQFRHHGHQVFQRIHVDADRLVGDAVAFGGGFDFDGDLLCSGLWRLAEGFGHRLACGAPCGRLEAAGGVFDRLDRSGERLALLRQVGDRSFRGLLLLQGGGEQGFQLCLRVHQKFLMGRT